MPEYTGAIALPGYQPYTGTFTVHGEGLTLSVAKKEGCHEGVPPRRLRAGGGVHGPEEDMVRNLVKFRQCAR